MPKGAAKSVFANSAQLTPLDMRGAVGAQFKGLSAILQYTISVIQLGRRSTILATSSIDFVTTFTGTRSLYGF